MIPCADPANNADDWFIEKDGKQYPDDVLVTDEQVDAYLAEVRTAYDATGLEDLDLPDREDARADLEAKAVKAALVRRRHARDKCHVECYFRLACLTQTLDGPGGTDYGTRGGYYPEELRKIENLRAERRARRAQQE